MKIRFELHYHICLTLLQDLVKSSLHIRLNPCRARFSISFILEPIISLLNNDMIVILMGHHRPEYKRFILPSPLPERTRSRKSGAPKH